MEDQKILEDIAINVIQGRVDQEDEGYDEGFEGQPGVTELVEQALERGIKAKDILLKGLTPPMEEVGNKFDRGVYLIPDMLASAECVGAAMDLLSPHLVKAGVESKGKYVIATVAEDLHDIGKNIVGIMIKGAGYDVIDLGADVAAEQIVNTVRENKAPYLGLSALLTTTMRKMPEVLDLLKEAGLRESVKVMIGGAPTSQAFAQEIGADAYCRDAFEAVEVLKSFAARDDARTSAAR
jgi:5-methyltetrahydrofolate--homocysteine methyltransferase